MADYMLSGFSIHQLPARSSSGSSHVRSYSQAPKVSPAQSNRVSRAISASSLHTTSAMAESPNLYPHSPSRLSTYNNDDESMSTIPDPRSRTMSPALGPSPRSPSQHPDLDDEVATLSTKLINAINHQTNLDNTLNMTRHELEASQDRVRQLESETLEHTSQINSGFLLPFKDVQAERKKMLEQLAEERKQREAAEKGKNGMELELENLTQSLFEEANKMVVNAREEAQKQQDALQRKNDQLKSQLADTESLLASHQEQLAQLKQVMEQMSLDQDDNTNPTAPSTPAMTRPISKEDVADSPLVFGEDVSPSYPTSFTHLLQPILRTDIAAYDDFMSLLRVSKVGSAPGSRVSSGNYSHMGLGLGQSVANGSTSSLAASPTTPTTPASAVSNGSSASTVVAPLKETRFYKRALAEDIEPTLRLDTAPGLSWLARRSVLTAMSEGSLVVEPMPVPSTAAQKLYIFACSLCGETRKDTGHARTHRFRTSDNDSAQRYPLCTYCLGRVRSTCDFLGFLRMLRDGHWRTEDEESEKSAWEESVRLREQMFWRRMGGGVVPAHHRHSQILDAKSPRTSVESEIMRGLKHEVEETGEIKPRDITPVTAPELTVEGEEAEAEAEGPALRGSQKPGKVELEEEEEGAPNGSEKIVGDAADVPTSVAPSNRDSTQTLAAVGGGQDEEGKRLSITIPGAFE